jgi:COP9 signalosome complex subunit 2
MLRRMLGYIDNSAITKNAYEKKINSLLDFMGTAQDSEALQVRRS